MASGYSALPPVYDRWQRSYGNDYTTLIHPRLRATLRALGLRRGSMLDLACGTGSLALLMERAGWEAAGIDGSPGMIEEARRKVALSGSSVRFSCQDMRVFETPEPVDLVTCMFDSFNHLLTARDLGRAFRAVRRSLRTGGYLVFDLNNLRAYRRHWRGGSSMHGEDFAVVLESSYDDARRLGTIQVTVFDREGDLFRRRRELVRERFYPRAEVHEQLRAAGFSRIRAADFNFTSHPEFGTLKTWWIARAG